MSNPCLNGGTCSSSSGSGGFTCSCVSGYTGDNCSITSSSKLQALTSQKESPQTSEEYSPQQTSELQQAIKLSSSEHWSLAAQPHSTMTAQTYHISFPPQPSYLPSGSYQLAQSTQQGVLQQTKALSSSYKEVTGQQLATLQPSPQASKEQVKSASLSQPQQQNQSNYPHTEAKTAALVSHVMNGSSIIPGIEYFYYLDDVRRGSLMVRALVSGSSRSGSSPGRGHCVVFLGKTPALLLQCLVLPMCIYGYRRFYNQGYRLVSYIQGGVGIFLVTLCFRNHDKLRPDGPIGLFFSSR